MTQSNLVNRGLLLPQVAPRGPVGGYRVTQAQVSTSFATKRVLGLWVPGDVLRRGTVIRFSGSTSTTSAIFRLGIGGDASANVLGVLNNWTTAPAAAVGFVLMATQRTDGLIPTFDTGGFYSGATSLTVSTGTFTPFIQPMNYIEVSTSGTFTCFGCVLEVIPPQYNHRSYQEMLDV